MEIHFTSSHTLAQLKPSLDTYKVVYATCTNSHKLLLEHFAPGMFIRKRHNPRKNMVEHLLMTNQGQSNGDMLQADFNLADDFEFCKEQIGVTSKDKKLIDSVMIANKICRDSAKEVNYEKRENMLHQALGACPKHCPMAHYFLFQIEMMQYVKKQYNPAKKMKRNLCVEKHAKKAVVAGRALADLLRARNFCEGNLYSFEPTRNYVRALFNHGNYLLSVGKEQEAYDLYQECLANDIHDSLGARHRQLKAVLGGKKGINVARMSKLLDASFGEDQVRDDVFALWNYTRALHKFIEKGRCKKTIKLLEHAIGKNPHVPPLLLQWEIGITGDTNPMMQIGEMMEAIDYVPENRKHWKNTEGALLFLEEVYCDHDKAKVPPISKQARKVLSEATELYVGNEQSPHMAKLAIKKYTELLSIIEDNKESTEVTITTLKHIGYCSKSLRNNPEAIKYFTTAYSLCTMLTDKDLQKELLYQLAMCKEDSGDYEGALRHYKTVKDRFGMFSTLLEGVKRIEEKIGRSTGICSQADSSLNFQNADDFSEKARNLCSNVPRNTSTSVASTLERCSVCARSGIKLLDCGGCDSGDRERAKYCSKDCQRKDWKNLHKHICKSSKSRLEAGASVRVEGLEKKPELNGKIASIVSFVKEKSRFVIDLEGENLSLKPQNLVLVKVS